VNHYHRDGYVFVRELLDAKDIDLLARAAKEDRALDEHAVGRKDGEGGTVRLSLWNHPGDGVYGMVARSRRIVDRVEQLLDDEAYHYHSKMIMKDAHTGGAWAWHQDYGYWYYNAVPAPNLCSVFIAVDRATRENGCLQVLRGSHQWGRLDHALTGDQAGADPKRVAIAKQRLELVYCEMTPGDALFFHANLLHRSDQNTSDRPRWSMVCCYNARSNNPYQELRHPCYTPLEKVDDEMIRQVGVKRWEDMAGEVAWLSDSNNTAKRIAAEQARLGTGGTN
jgi:ectoine hydroxylase-related dioxygenase (phytanoyl-CoA dioxygenase family)